MNEKYKSIKMITKIRNNMSFKYIMQSKGLKGLNTFLFFQMCYWKWIWVHFLWIDSW